VGTLVNLTTGKTIIYDTTDSVDTGTGSLIVSGGIAAVKNVNFGNNLTVTNTITCSNEVASANNYQYSTSNSTGSFDFSAMGLSSPVFNFYNNTASVNSSTINTGVLQAANSI